MSTGNGPARLDELLALEATQGLAPAEATELDALLAALPNEDPDAFERAAAAVHLALSGPPEPLPAWLAERLQLTALAFVPPPARPRTRVAWGTWAGWAVAAGLAAVLAFTLWSRPEPPVAERKKEPEPPVAERKKGLEQDPAAKALRFAGEAPGAAGDVVWSTEKQEGYAEVRGLPPLDPTKEQYQFWIVDPSKKQPVDGGVFDVKPDGTALVRVRAPIQVKDAKAFAVTKETAGGVVVSDGPMLLVLKPKPG